MPDLKLKSGINFTDKIIDRTFNFTGREWVFQAIHQWISDPNGSRYFLLTGEPGAGKTAISDRLSQFSSSPEPLHPNLLPGFLSAVHRCSACDSTTVDPKTFARAIALQLAQQIPAFAQALKDIGDKQVNIQIEQHIPIATNSIQGIIIQNLDLPSPNSQRQNLKCKTTYALPTQEIDVEAKAKICSKAKYRTKTEWPAITGM